MIGDIVTEEPDKKHKCGCVTFWKHWRKGPALYYRKACKMHAWYASRLGILVAAK